MLTAILGPKMKKTDRINQNATQGDSKKIIKKLPKYGQNAGFYLQRDRKNVAMGVLGVVFLQLLVYTFLVFLTSNS